jgi:hypothetical protein
VTVTPVVAKEVNGVKTDEARKNAAIKIGSRRDFERNFMVISSSSLARVGKLPSHLDRRTTKNLWSIEWKPNYNGLQKAEAEVLLLQETSLARNFKGGH